VSRHQLTLSLKETSRTICLPASSDAALLSQKISGPVLVVHPISSLDDGIDFANQTADSPLAASFIFAALPEANYLANFIDAHICCVNLIPAELLGMHHI
jgi:acyl-CoA reductase-like NAD-dependent aldehyde dehydrogenase